MPIKLKPLAEQVIVVTGATSGNGLATVEAAVATGAAVVAVARNAAALEALRARLMAQGGRIAICVADVADPAALERAAAVATAAFGGFDSWVSNAGTGTYGALEAVPLADHRRVFDVNYFGVLHGSLIAARYLRRRGGGAIVTVGSVLGERAIVAQGPYSATKHAVAALTETLRMELAGTGISVSLIKPAAIDTPFADHARNFMASPPRLPQPLYRPEVVADAILHACAHQVRTLYAGGGGWLESTLARLAPGVADRIMELAGRRAQQAPRRPGDPTRRDNLYAPRADGLRGSQGFAARRTSLFLQAQKAPGVAVGAGLLGVAALVLGRRLARR